MRLRKCLSSDRKFLKEKMIEMKKLLFIVILGFFLLSGNIYAQDKLYPNTFPLGDVTLLGGPFKNALDLNIQTLLKYDVDRLLATYLIEA